jgi:hypothetical protein
MDSDPFIDPDRDLWNCLKQVAGFGVVALLLVLPPATLSQLRPVPKDAAAGLATRAQVRPANSAGAQSRPTAARVVPDVPENEAHSTKTVPVRSLSSMV